MYSPSACCYKMQCSIGSQCISTGHSNVEEVTKPIQVEEMAGMALEEETYTHRYRGRYWRYMYSDWRKLWFGENYGCSSFHRMQIHSLTSFSLAIRSANFGSLGVISCELEREKCSWISAAFVLDFDTRNMASFTNIIYVIFHWQIDGIHVCIGK